MKIKRILSATLAAAMLLCCCALTACASKPAAPTAADFEVQPGVFGILCISKHCNLDRI